MGPLAGKHGGEIDFSGNINGLLKAKTLTAKYLKKDIEVSIPKKRNNASMAQKNIDYAVDSNH